MSPVGWILFPVANNVARDLIRSLELGCAEDTDQDDGALDGLAQGIAAQFAIEVVDGDDWIAGHQCCSEALFGFGLVAAGGDHRAALPRGDRGSEIDQVGLSGSGARSAGHMEGSDGTGCRGPRK